MAASQRLQAPLLLLILAVPMAMIAIAAGVGLQSGSLWHWAELSPLFLGIPGGVLAIRGLSLAPKPSQPVDVRRFERQGRSILLALAFVIGLVALLVAAAISPTVGLFMVGVAALWVLLWTPPSLRRVKVETSLLIQRDSVTVFSFVADSQNEPLYMPTVLSVEKITDGPVGPGTQFRAKMQLTPATTWEAIGGIVDYEPDSRVTSRVTSGSTPNLDAITFTPADGGTLLSARFESEVSFNLALVGAALRMPQARRQMIATRQSGWINLKQILENTESDPPKT
jgi:hypothetical protein